MRKYASTYQVTYTTCTTYVQLVYIVIQSQKSYNTLKFGVVRKFNGS